MTNTTDNRHRGREGLTEKAQRRKFWPREIRLVRAYAIPEVWTKYAEMK